MAKRCVILLTVLLVLAVPAGAFAETGKIGGAYWFAGGTDVYLDPVYWGEGSLILDGDSYILSGELYLTPRDSIELLYMRAIQPTLLYWDDDYSEEFFGPGTSASSTTFLAFGKHAAYGSGRLTLKPFVGYYSSTTSAGVEDLKLYSLHSAGFLFGGEAQYDATDRLTFTAALGYSPFIESNLICICGPELVDSNSTLWYGNIQASYWLTPSITIDGGYRYISLSVNEMWVDGPMCPAFDLRTDGLFVGMSYHF